VLVGRIVKPHGIRGEVVVQVLSDVPGRLDAGSSLLVTGEEGEPLRPGARPGLPARLTIASSRPSKGPGQEMVLVRFEGVEERDRAAEIAGAWLAVERSRVPPAPEGSYYRYELVGCRCRDGARELGRVVDVIEDGGGLLLIVEGPADEPAGGSARAPLRRVPVPFVERFLREVDVAEGEIVLDLPPGLVEECASTS
jgi:16S rRNA processing protein RimM